MTESPSACTSSAHPMAKHCHCHSELSHIRQTAICHDLFLPIHPTGYSSIHFLQPWTLVYCSHTSAQVFPQKNMDTCTALCTHSKSSTSGKQQMLPLWPADTQQVPRFRTRPTGCTYANLYCRVCAVDLALFGSPANNIEVLCHWYMRVG